MRITQLFSYHIRYHNVFWQTFLCATTRNHGKKDQMIAPGSFRFNTDSAKLEYFKGNTIGWVEVKAELASDVLGGGSGSNEGLGHRGVNLGYSPSITLI